ncbi:hypothetical protein MalM25_25710 [Planctomycetes bacterium MalM25]|nr:hypothetical protein MalM25_25710 [Planctomycetes bacterium MalM25]
MDRNASRTGFVLAAFLLMVSTGCHPGLMIATAQYMIDGGDLVDPECEALDEKKVVVFCRPPASHEFRHAGASQMIAKQVSDLLEMNVPKVEVVKQSKVDQWVDENDTDDYEELGRAVGADMVVHIELGHFELFKGKTVYQGNADVTVSTYDMNENAKLVWKSELGEVLFPVHSGIAVQDKAVSQFQKEFVGILSEKVARNYYKHPRHEDFAMDALANR